jgi:hypothetical protein
MAAEVPDEEGTGDVFSWFGFRGGRRRLFLFNLSEYTKDRMLPLF